MAETCTRCRTPARAASSAIRRAPGALDLGEVAGAALGQDADEVDDDLGAVDGAADGGGIRHRRVEGHDLAGGAERLEERAAFGVAAGDADDVALADEVRHQIAADETRPAEDRGDFPCLRDHAGVRPFSVT